MGTLTDLVLALGWWTLLIGAMSLIVGGLFTLQNYVDDRRRRRAERERLTRQRTVIFDPRARWPR